MNHHLESIIGLKTQIRVLLAGFGPLSLSLTKHLIGAPEIVTLAGLIPASNLKRYRFLTEHPSEIELMRLAAKYQIRILTAPGINSSEFELELSEIKPHILLVGGWSEIIWPKILATPGLTAINCHGSLLPRYRGASPYVATIFNGDQKTGLTFHLIDEGIDTGDILRQKEFVVGKGETALQLERRMAENFGEAIVTLLCDLKSGKVVPKKQSGIPSYVPKYQPEWGWIPWGATPEVIDQRMRALQGFVPLATALRGQVLGFESGCVVRTTDSPHRRALIGLSKKTIAKNNTILPGEVLNDLPDKIIVATCNPAIHVELNKPVIMPSGTETPHIRPGDRFLSIACNSILKSA